MKLRYPLILAVSLASLYILGRQFNWADLDGALQRMNLWYLLPGAVCYLMAILARALRWQVMVKPIRFVGLWPLFQYVTLGFMTNNLLPARLGEVVRAYVTGKKENTSRSAMFASIVLERIFDGLTIVLLLILTLFFNAMRHPLLLHLAWASSAFFVFGFLFLLLLTYRRTLALSLAQRVLFFLPQPLRVKAGHILGKFVQGLVLLHHPRAFVKVLLLSFVVWMAELSVYLCFNYAFPMVQVGLPVIIIALVFVNLSSMLPALPANALVFQVACSQALVIFGHVPESPAVLYSVILHATQIFPMIILGYVFMGFLGLTWREIRSVEIEDSENRVTVVSFGGEVDHGPEEPR